VNYEFERMRKETGVTYFNARRVTHTQETDCMKLVS
jgi:hypothetical protein